MSRTSLVSIAAAAILAAALLPSANAAVNASPVVQLISYRDIYGKHVEMLGWGSASIINDKGVIISNNHVVDDGTGHIATAFSVCVTKQAKARPSCDYTASLIDRNETMDIALLKIDPKDVQGNAVDYTQFQKLDIDFNYTPTAQDDALIVGYPWIGADTITETKGIVSGTTDYNGFQYIKTDAVIAGGNSGGAMINKAGKLIGIPTFTLGGFFDSTLGYGLSIKEAQKFIEDTMGKAPMDIKQTIDFAAYQKLLDNINKEHAVKDDFVTMTFPTDYEIRNYLRNRHVELTAKSMKDIAVTDLSIELLETPELKSEKDFLYYTQMMGLYSPDYTRLIKKDIGGRSFFLPVYSGDPSQGGTSDYNYYFSQLSPRLMVMMSVQAPLYDEKNNERVQQEISNVLKGVTFNSGASSLESSSNPDSFKFNLAAPKLSIVKTSDAVSNERQGMYVKFFDNLHDYAALSLELKTLYSGKGQSTDDLIAMETKGVPQEYVARVELQGMKGYVACQPTPYGATPNIYVSNPYYLPEKDEKGTALAPQQTCLFRFVEGLKDAAGNEYFLNVLVNGTQSSLNGVLDKTSDFLRNNVMVGQGETNLRNPFASVVRLDFTDIENQSEEFKQSLQVLVRYGLLQNGKFFDPYRALRWKDFLPLYLRGIYNVDISKNSRCRKVETVCQMRTATMETPSGTMKIQDILTAMKINPDDLVPRDSLMTFDLVFRAHLAGTTIGNGSSQDISNYMMNPQVPRFTDAYAALSALDTFYYGPGKIDMSGGLSYWSTFNPEKRVYYSPSRGVRTTSWLDDTSAIDFSQGASFTYQQGIFDVLKEQQARYKEAYTTLTGCLNKPAATTDCLKNYTLTVAKLMQEDQEENFSFDVLTRGDAYNYVMQNIDLGLFDPELAKGKGVEIEE